MNPVDEIAEKLSEHPRVKFIRTENSISVEPETDSGFTVQLTTDGRRSTVYYEGWHEEFESGEEAVSCFAFGLSASCRLAVTYRGSFPCKWAVQYLNKGEWTTESVTGLLLVPFWRRPRVVFKQNDLVPNH
jgi:hypothetical protein